jgi:hypothetical protein
LQVAAWPTGVFIMGYCSRCEETGAVEELEEQRERRCVIHPQPKKNASESECRSTRPEKAVCSNLKSVIVSHH